MIKLKNCPHNVLKTASNHRQHHCTTCGRAFRIDPSIWVNEFHEELDRPARFEPVTNYPLHERVARARLIGEEVSELTAELGQGTPDIYDIAKEAADSVFVTMGVFGEIGIPFLDAFEAVCNDNLAKARAPKKFDEFGKLLKPDGYKKLDLRLLL